MGMDRTQRIGNHSANRIPATPLELFSPISLPYFPILYKLDKSQLSPSLYPPLMYILSRGDDIFGNRLFWSYTTPSKFKT